MLLSRKNKAILMKGLAVLGGAILGLMLWRSYKAQKDTGGKVTFTEAFKANWKQATMLCVGWLAFVAVVFLASTGNVEGAIYAQVVGVVASGVAVNTNLPTLTYVPQFIYFEIATVPQSIKVNVNGDGLICDLDSAGITAMCNIRSNGRPTNGYLLQLSNGLVVGKNVDISITNGVATAFTVFGINANEVVDVPAYMVTTGIQINASQSFNLSNFSYCAIPSFVAADILNIFGAKRSITGMPNGQAFSTKQEVETLRGLMQLTENMTVAKNAIDNFDGTWLQLNFTPNAAQRIYVQRPIEVGKFTPVLLQ
jgi:hypothetical protein